MTPTIILTAVACAAVNLAIVAPLARAIFTQRRSRLVTVVTTRGTRQMTVRELAALRR
jgi:hypothetical protein